PDWVAGLPDRRRRIEMATYKLIGHEIGRSPPAVIRHVFRLGRSRRHRGDHDLRGEKSTHGPLQFSSASQIELHRETFALTPYFPTDNRFWIGARAFGSRASQGSRCDVNGSRKSLDLGGTGKKPAGPG